MSGSSAMAGDPAEIFENEWLIVRYSGEIPEIAFHSAMYYLTRDREGPRLCLDEAQVDSLKHAAVDRYAEIVLRDLQHSNAAQPIYRGVGRSIINYRRFCRFCSREQLDTSRVRSLAAEGLRLFLETEMERVMVQDQPSIINCTYAELQGYALELGLGLPDWGVVLENHCPVSSS